MGLVREPGVSGVREGVSRTEGKQAEEEVLQPCLRQQGQVTEMEGTGR